MRLGLFQLASASWATLRRIRRRTLRRRWLAAVLTCLSLPLLLHGWQVAFGGNFHTVLAGTVYRSAQPSIADLQALVAAHHIRTIINLRGECPDPWYFEEHEKAKALNVQVVDVGLWASQPPPADQFPLLVEALADAPGPILIHCLGGNDRSGLASALAILLRSDGTIGEARRQLSIYYGHNPFGKASCHRRVLDRYEEWLAKNNWAHTAARLRAWAHKYYVPDECWPDGHQPPPPDRPGS
jgi:protein tyrosine/serine phosphatase